VQPPVPQRSDGIAGFRPPLFSFDGPLQIVVSALTWLLSLGGCWVVLYLVPRGLFFPHLIPWLSLFGSDFLEGGFPTVIMVVLRALWSVVLFTDVPSLHLLLIVGGKYGFLAIPASEFFRLPSVFPFQIHFDLFCSDRHPISSPFFFRL